MAKKHLEEKKIFGSLNIIVKDEEKNLREILKNVQNVFDEVIIVDIGSKDLSPNIAGELGVKVITHRWMEDFSKVRNMALEKSTGEWIFYIDANERINRDDAVMIKSLIDKPTKFDAFLFPVITMVESKELESLEMIRLFRNNNEYSFQGRVFEQIGPSIIKNGGKIKRIKDIKILNNISSIDSIQENVKRNLNLLKKQLEDEPKDPYMLTQTAWTAYKASDLLFAKKTAAKVLKIQNAPDTFRFRCFLLLGKIALDEKDHVKCEEFFDLALSLDPKSRELFFLLGLLNREKGENDQAIDFFENALKTPVKLSYHVPDIRVSKVDIHYNIAYSNLYLGEYSKAVESLEFLLEEEEHISSYLLLSEIFLKQADYQKALEYLEKAKKIDSHNSQIYTKIGNIYFQQGDFKRAGDAYKTAAENGADSPEVLNNIASTFAASGQNDKAEEFFTKSVEKNPKFHEGHKNLGYFYMNQKKFDKAIESFEKAYTLKPIAREAGDRLGEIYYINGDFENSYRIYKSLINLFPGDPRLYNNLGVCALNLDKMKEAIKLFTSALELYPDYKDARDNLESIMKENKG